ncbi:7292_t:CDS:2 [Entrophospora sp. SA101]|nr:7292_t:CDS:2 [Entrophospora sp. SA101]
MSDVQVNSLIDNQYYPGDIGWVLVSTALVWLMIPGVGFFYGGMARSKNALSLYFLGILTVAVVSLQWFMFGYSLTFSTTGNAFIGNFDNALFLGLKFGPSPVSTRIPDLLYATYEGMFAAITPAIAIGLVCITPGSGYVNIQYAPLFGLIGSVSCNLALKLKSLLSFDDALDVFAVHGVGGFVGNLLTGLFADKNVASLSGEEIQGGAINGYYRQFGIQLANSLAALSIDAENEERGIDEVELGEQAHYFVERYSSALKDLTATKSALAKSKSNASLNKHFRQQNLHNQRIEEIPLPPTHNYI